MAKDKAFARLPGFRDFPPDELRVRTHVFDHWRSTALRYGFQEYDGPPLESLDLYTEKSGEEIVGQLYAFEDKGGRNITLRPEMTPSLARILGQRSRAMPKPIRWFTLPQLFRYERQQKGRLREHFQWNVDIVGEAGVGADAEILAVALDALRSLGLGADDIVARVSDRRLLSAVLLAAGVPEGDVLTAFQIVDKVEREDPARSLERFSTECGLDPDATKDLLDLINEGGLDDVRKAHGDDDVVSGALSDLDEYRDTLGRLGFADFLDFDLRIVRGLAYYTGIVFEIFDRDREFRAVCGGGRYDRLLELVGGEPLPAAGFGMGDVVLTELLSAKGLLPEARQETDLFIVSITHDLRPLVHELARAHREKGRRVVYALKGQGVKKQFSAASNAGARWVVVLGPDEVEQGFAVVRDMASGSEERVDLAVLKAGDGLEGDGLQA